MRVRFGALALLCLASGPAFASPHPTSMTRYNLRTTPDEWQVRCNDGTVPLFYYLPGSGDGADKWIIHLEGGASCQTSVECEERATGSKPELMGTGCTMDGAGVVTCGQAVGALAGLGGAGFTATYNQRLGATKSYDGIHSSATDNPFYNWNRVEARYCSSDTWAGQGALAPTDAAPGSALFSQFTVVDAMGVPIETMPPALLAAGAAFGPWPAGSPWENVWIQDHAVGGVWAPSTGFYSTLSFTEATLLFNGRNIVERLVDQLLDGDFNADGVDDGALSLDEASVVVFSGSSAGGVGARTNLDAVGDQIAAANPGVSYAGLVEGAFSGGSDPGLTAGLYPALSSSVTGVDAEAWSRLLYWGAFVDESCETALAVGEIDPVTIWEGRGACYNLPSLIEGDHLDTPHAARHALWDQITRPDLGTDTDDRRGQQQLIEYGGWHLTQASQLRAFFFPCVNQHVVLTDNSFYDQGVDQASGGGGTTGDSFADVLTRWGTGDDLHLAATGCTP